MVEARRLEIDGNPATVWTGGEGDPLVLLHGAWAGAAAHWSTVWDRLSERYRVIAPDLPGLAEGSPRGPSRIGEFATWVERVLDALGVGAAWLVGNSFGAAVASRLAAQAPHRCAGLVLVDGGPPPGLPPLALRIIRLPLVRSVVAAGFKHSAYSASTLKRAFADPGKAPPEVVACVTQRSPRQFELMSDVFFAPDPPLPLPQARIGLIWGAADRLGGSSPAAARMLSRRLKASRLVVIPDAGHLPQVERPDAFIEALVGFVESGGGDLRHAAADVAGSDDARDERTSRRM